jgi:lipocalin-like protein
MVKRRALVALVGVVVAVSQGASTRTDAQARNPFVGTWKLIAIETRGADGKPIPGPNPVGGVNPAGTVMYDAAGHVSLQIMPSGRPASLNTLQPLTPEQAKEALFGYVAYYGTYTLDERAKVMHIHFDGSLNPSMVGTDGERYYEFDGDRMTFRAGANTRLSWEHVR